MKTIDGCKFKFVETLKLEKDDRGNIAEYMPQNNYNNKNNIRLNKFGSGSYCKFTIDKIWRDKAGVYIFYIDNSIIYIGQTIDLYKRFQSGYGNISPRNCYIGGQTTNCKMNQIILQIYKRGKTINIYFYETDNYNELETKLIGRYQPILNGTLTDENDLAEKIHKFLNEDI